MLYNTRKPMDSIPYSSSLGYAISLSLCSVADFNVEHNTDPSAHRVERNVVFVVGGDDD